MTPVVGMGEKHRPILVRIFLLPVQPQLLVQHPEASVASDAETGRELPRRRPLEAQWMDGPGLPSVGALGQSPREVRGLGVQVEGAVADDGAASSFRRLLPTGSICRLLPSLILTR